MQPEEARKRWCPFSAGRAVSIPVGSDGFGHVSYRAAHITDGSGSGDITLNCLAHKCMAWRWTTDFNVLMGMPTMKDVPFDEIPERGDGFCGMAGDPDAGRR